MVVMKSRKISPRTQQGGALIILVLILVIAGTTALFSVLDGNGVRIERDKKTAAALAEAKAALIGYVIARDDDPDTILDERPGEFPCPDTNNDGVANSPCVAGRLGRIPWRNLNIEAPLDGNGEILWYAVSGVFRNIASNSAPINSDTHANIMVLASDGVSALTNEAVAIIFSAGAPIGVQSRGAASAACPTTSTTIAANLCAANYLETSAGTNNATTNGPFIDGVQSEVYNDRVGYILTKDFMPEIEERVARTLKPMLANYFSVNGVYPWPDDFSGPNADGISDIGASRGRLPLTASPSDWTGSYDLPDWFMNNQWYNLIYYVKGTLTVDGVAGTQALFFMPGTPVGAIVRPSNTLTDYLQDAENNDGSDDIYVTPTSQNHDHDRLYVLP